MKRAYAYTRVTFGELKRNRNFIKEQKQRIQDYCTHNGLELAETYDDFLPPYKDMFDLLIARCGQEDSPDEVIITAWNRIPRRKYFLYEVVESFAKKDIKLVVLDELNDEYKETKVVNQTHKKL